MNMLGNAAKTGMIGFQVTPAFSYNTPYDLQLTFIAQT
jgi:hypothetical protein